MSRVLIVDDEGSYRRILSRSLSRRGHVVASARCAEEALDVASEMSPEVLIADLMLSDKANGLELFNALRMSRPTLQCILITGFPALDLGVEAERSGVFEVLEKPFDLFELLDCVDHALQR